LQFDILKKLCFLIAITTQSLEKTLMKNLLFILFVSLAFVFSTNAQTTPTTTPAPKTTAEEKPKKQIFRANKEQIMQAQKMLKVTETGNLDDDTRAAIKTYQPANGLKATGTLNRATLEKMNIALTDKQKEIPVSPNSFASADSDKSDASSKPKKVIFRASKDRRNKQHETRR
jgi:murein L,D-transpeptidase YcbB/YkuD